MVNNLVQIKYEFTGVRPYDIPVRGSYTWTTYVDLLIIVILDRGRWSLFGYFYE